MIVVIVLVHLDFPRGETREPAAGGSGGSGVFGHRCAHSAASRAIFTTKHSPPKTGMHRAILTAGKHPEEPRHRTSDPASLNSKRAICDVSQASPSENWPAAAAEPATPKANRLSPNANCVSPNAARVSRNAKPVIGNEKRVSSNAQRVRLNALCAISGAKSVSCFPRCANNASRKAGRDSVLATPAGFPSHSPP